MDSLENKQSVSLDAVVTASSELVAANLDGEVVILGFQSGSYYSLDQVGVFVWDLIQQPRKVTELRDAICAEYDIEPARAESDLLALLQQLAEKQLLEIRTEAVA